jgi:hypothetical protein
LELATRLPRLTRTATVPADMSPLALHFLRRLSGLVVLSAVGLAVWWRGSAELGLDAAERIASADAAVAVAREYGAAGEGGPFAAAERELAAARERLQAGDRRQARRLAVSAEANATEAQRVVIGEKQALRGRSDEIAARVDKELNSIERLYTDTVKAVRKGRAAEMLTRMKQTRATGAALILAHEQGDHRKVVQDEPAVSAYLAQTRRQFEEAAH